MADASIALNRFGLGGRPGDDPGADSRRWLKAQFARYQPAPPQIAALPASPVIAGELIDYQQALRAARRDKRPASGSATKRCGAGHGNGRARDAGRSRRRCRDAHRSRHGGQAADAADAGGAGR